MAEPGMISRASFTVTLPEGLAHKLKTLAAEAGVTPEELLRSSMEEWLSHPREDFARAADYVLRKNAELYRRLA